MLALIAGGDHDVGDIAVRQPGRIDHNNMRITLEGDLQCSAGLLARLGDHETCTCRRGDRCQLSTESNRYRADLKNVSDRRVPGLDGGSQCLR